ncbi:hypothetical protein SLEP1_g52285 [Rubroshorea leprosula]|uniref:TFIIS N-terminal domain-containing protein n=1 Tax=Rubroshorea leprosula TaxID=152421 RepID=A0AAV5M839_9ROSI|nr:hypothetical protein SLEP1_g52285 [Rubroshorea leprosula]
MAMKASSLDHWRNYFRTANSDIFDIIDQAILVAALDCPKEFRLRRDQIVEKLFTCRWTRCSGCDRVELAVQEYEDESGRGCKSGFDGEDGRGCEFEIGGSKGSKVNSSRDDHGEMNMNQIASNYSYGEAEALTEEIEEELQIVEEVLRIKEILENNQDESDSVLVELLRRLQLMALTVDTLKTTGIGKAVNSIRKHGSKQIRHLAQILIDGWKELVDEWVNATKAIAESTPESVNPSVVDEEEEEEGLPSPPLDEGAFFATQPTSIEFERFFECMDDDGNPRNCGEFIKNRDNGRRPSQVNQKAMKQKQQTPKDANMVAKDNTVQQTKRQETVVKPNNRPLNTDLGSARPPRQSAEQKANNELKLQQKSEKMVLEKKPLSSQQEKFKSSDEVSVQQKLEATKKKLQERYQQAENAKRQRTIQVMDLHDLPKQGLGQKNTHIRPGIHNRHWANGRR